ncbi:phage tail protein, partial [Pectobacterium versatile]|nr:phage tail protein [Pectobacterium versatile]
MAIEEYVGSIVLEIDSRELECTDLKVTSKTGRKLVKTMNKTGRAKGFARGIAEYQLAATVVIPLDGDLDWDGMEGG